MTDQDIQELIKDNKKVVDDIKQIATKIKNSTRDEFLMSGLQLLLKKCKEEAKNGNSFICVLLPNGVDDVLQDMGFIVEKTEQVDMFKISWI
jgi:hypothetical protein